MADMETRGWQPIETAPRDGSRILLRCGNTVTEGRWVQEIDPGAVQFVDCWQTFAAGRVRADWPDRWQPLPPPPEAEK